MQFGNNKIKKMCRTYAPVINFAPASLAWSTLFIVTLDKTLKNWNRQNVHQQEEQLNKVQCSLTNEYYGTIK